MRRAVSPEAREKLWHMLAQMNTAQPPEAMTDAICEWYESQNTFNDVIDNGKDKKQCPVCKKLYCIYPINLRKPLMPILKHLSEVGLLSPQALYKKYRESAKSMKFYQMKHWGIVDKDTYGNFFVTEKGKMFLEGKISIPSRLWTFMDELVDPPEGKQNGENVYIWQVAPEDFSERKKHVEDAVSGFQEQSSFISPLDL